MTEPVWAVCLVGSSRFKEHFLREAERLEKSGALVLMMGFFQHADGVSVSPAERETLRRVDRRRIDLCDEVRVINPGGYIGEDTTLELEYARGRGKKLTFLEPEHDRPRDRPGRPGRPSAR